MKKALRVVGLCLLSSTAAAAPINTNDVNVYNAFAAGATLVDFSNVAGLTPFPLDSYVNAANSTTTVPASAQLSGQVPGVFFHSGGASFNNPVGNPGTPVALLQLGGAIAGDARSATNVIGSLEINTQTLDIDNFVEIIFLGGDVNRAGVWLNPSLGDVLISAFDNTGQSLESVAGTAGNFAGFLRATNDIRFISIVTLTTGTGFTADDLTYGRVGTTTPVDAPPILLLLVAALAALAWSGRSLRLA